MGENIDFTEQLKSAIKEKADWFNQEQLGKLSENYHLLHTCVRNLYDVLVKRALISPDPYKSERKISEITSPDESPFSENERSMAIGSRFSEYESMLDFICTYVKFSTEYLDIPKIKRLNDLNNSFQWGSLTLNNSKTNTRGLASLIQEARTNTSQMQLSMLTDAITKSAQAVTEITAILKDLTDFQRESYKLQIRLNFYNHPNFDKEKAFSSPSNQISEIKRLFPQVMGKMPFYSELVNEIIEEDQGNNKEAKQQFVLSKLQVSRKIVKEKVSSVNTKEMILEALHTLTNLSDVYGLVAEKLSNNVNVLEGSKNSLGTRFKRFIRKIFNLKEPELIYTFIIVDQKKGTKSSRSIDIRIFIGNIIRKSKFYAALANKAGPEFHKVKTFEENAILEFTNKNIMENQEILSLLDAGDEYFKQNVPANERAKIKGLKMDLITIKNIVVKSIQKRTEYCSYIEEQDQMRKLGIK